MHRRQVLSAIGAVTAGTLAGCTGTDPDSATPTVSTDEETVDGSTTRTLTDDEEWNPGSDSPFETIVVGSRGNVDFPSNNRPPEVTVWNNGDERTLTLTLRSTESIRMRTTVEFPADGWLRLRSNDPSAGTLTIDVEGQRAGEIPIGAFFDCNDSTTTVTVRPDGELTTRTLSTEIACPGPTIAGRSVSSGTGSCRPEDAAEVTVENERVTIEGRIKAPTPCYGLELASATLENAERFRSGEDTLVVTVATTDPSDQACVQCVGSVPYTARIAFENAYPSTVRVVHRSMDGERTVLE